MTANAENGWELPIASIRHLTAFGTYSARTDIMSQTGIAIPYPLWTGGELHKTPDQSGVDASSR
jgi:hypothetical protein